MDTKNIPAWAQGLKELFCSSAVSQFLLYGNIFDLVPYSAEGSACTFMPLDDFLGNVMFDGYDTVIFYDRGNGIKVTRGDKDWSEWLDKLCMGTAIDINTIDPFTALKLIDRYILRTLNLQAVCAKEGKKYQRKVAVIIDYAQFIVPSGDALQFANDLGSNIVNILNWASDPAILNSNIVTVLVSEKLNDVNRLIVENSHTAKIEIKLPDETEMSGYIDWLRSSVFTDIEAKSDVTMPSLARYMTGLSRIAAKNIIAFALKNNYRIKEDLLKARKKEAIEKECQGLLEFYESTYNFDMLAGMEPVKEWLRQDAALLRAGKVNALPMGYLISGRIGTGKTFLVQCWAGELVVARVPI